MQWPACAPSGISRRRAGTECVGSALKCSLDTCVTRWWWRPGIESDTDNWRALNRSNWKLASEGREVNTNPSSWFVRFRLQVAVAGKRLREAADIRVPANKFPDWCCCCRTNDSSQTARRWWHCPCDGSHWDTSHSNSSATEGMFLRSGHKTRTHWVYSDGSPQA